MIKNSKMQKNESKKSISPINEVSTVKKNVSAMGLKVSITRELKKTLM